MTPWSNVCFALPAFDPPCICHITQYPINRHNLSCSKIKSLGLGVAQFIKSVQEWG